MNGYLYIAIGQKYANQFRQSLIHLRQVDPTTPIAVISDVLPESDVYKLIPSATVAKYETRSIKTSLDKLTPFERTFYLDTDTIAVSSPIQAFDYLERAPIAATIDDEMTLGSRVNLRITEWHHKYLGTEELEFTRAYPADTTLYNGGAFLWERGPQSTAFFEHWRKEWERYRRTDQMALARTFHDGKYEVTALPKIYNLSYNHPNAADVATARLAGVKIVHFWLDGQIRMAQWGRH